MSRAFSRQVLAGGASKGQKPRRGGAWRTFAVARTKPDGRFAHAYRFQN